MAVFITKTSCFISWREIIAVYREKSMLHIDTLYEQNWKLRNFKSGSVYSDHSNLELYCVLEMYTLSCHESVPKSGTVHPQGHIKTRVGKF